MAYLRVLQRSRGSLIALAVTAAWFLGAPNPTYATIAGSPPVIDFTASPASIGKGGSARLTWSVANADSCTASGAWSGTRSTTGSQSTGPLNSAQEYRLTCSGKGGNRTANVWLAVTSSAVTSPPTLSFTASPTSVAPSGASTLTWAATNATACTASGAWSGSRVVSGSQSTGAVTANRNYTLTCTGAGGTVTRAVTVAVASQAPVSLTLSANPPSVPANGSTTLTWTSTGATSCSASGGWSGTRAANGSASVGPITRDTTYTLSCSGSGSTAVRMNTVVLRETQLTWRAPTRNVDGTPLRDLASYRIHFGNASRRYTQRLTVSGTSLARTVSLAPGTWFLALTAINSRGEESAYSSEVTRVIP